MSGLQNFKAIRRGDGEPIGDYAWIGFESDAAAWDVAEDHDEEEVVWEVVEMRPRLIERRTYRYGRWADDPDRAMCEDCGGDHLGTGSVCEA